MSKIAMVFPGSDSQFVGMYKALFDEYSIVRETIQEAEAVTGVPLRELCFKGPLGALGRSENAHVAVVAFGVAAFRVFVSETGLAPSFCAGHSLGEFSALVSSGALKLSDALRLVQLRTEISKEVQKSSDGGMTIVDKIASEQVEEICRAQRRRGKKVFVSCYNSPTQTAISGVQSDVEVAERSIREQGGNVTPLFLSAPFHSPTMEPGIPKLAAALDEVSVGEFRYPVLSNYSGRPYTGAGAIKSSLLHHMTHPVRWTEIMNYFREKKVDLVVDLSARNIFENLIGDREGIRTSCFGVLDERETLFSLLDKGNYRANKSSFLSKSVVAATSTPNRMLESDRYTLEVTPHFAELEGLHDSLEQGQKDLDVSIKKTIVSILRKIFEAKGLDLVERESWIGQILDETASTYLYSTAEA